MKTLLFTFSIFIMLIFTGCCMPISHIVNNPAKYRGKTVAVKGRVINTLRLEDLSFFTIKNNGSKINVVTTNFLPVKDDFVRVKGAVDDKFYYQRDTILVIKEYVEVKKDLKPDFNRMVN
ncbi:MAG: hypothetical protein MJ211_11190 [Bacteroidales bacterium]|nr:hypothetical protein [Bacteroidales bacterium]